MTTPETPKRLTKEELEWAFLCGAASNIKGTGLGIQLIRGHIAALEAELAACRESPGGCGYWREAAREREKERDQARSELERVKGELASADEHTAWLRTQLDTSMAWSSRWKRAAKHRKKQNARLRSTLVVGKAMEHHLGCWCDDPRLVAKCGACDFKKQVKEALAPAVSGEGL